MRQILLSNPQSIVAPIISKLPESNANLEASNSRLVVTMKTPSKITHTARYPIGLNLSLNIRVANNIENTVSPLANSYVSAAVVRVSPRKNRTGAMVAPQTAVAKMRK